jgi:hypothetical protein
MEEIMPKIGYCVGRTKVKGNSGRFTAAAAKVLFHDALAAMLLACISAAICRADVPTVPVLFIPGYAASHPDAGTLASFTFNRGTSPTDLSLSASYDLLVRSLTRAGYVSGKTFFGAVFDWRMKAAPDDGSFNGILANVTAIEITSGNFQYAVNYLGYWLDQVVQANPGVPYVDVVTHSTGGILARAYIQSPAYGASYVDGNGILRQLPRIRNLILGADPNEGTVHSWRPWSGDFQDVLSGFIPTTEVEGRFAALAFAYVTLGGTISGPDHDITLASSRTSTMIHRSARQFFSTSTLSPLRETTPGSASSGKRSPPTPPVRARKRVSWISSSPEK